MVLSEHIVEKLNFLINKSVTERKVAKNVIDDLIRNHKFNSKTRNEITNYFYNAIRYYGLFADGIDINDSDKVKNLLEKTEYNKDFPKTFIGVNDVVSELIYKNIDKKTFLSFLKRAPLTIRVNTLKITRELLKQKYDFFKDTYISPFGLFTEQHLNARQFSEFKKGYFEIQDEASQLIYFLVNPKPSEKILDICAGTGGKTLQLLATGINPDIHVFDINKNRLRILEKRVKLNKFKVNILKKLTGKFDKVLIDAPCSGSGSVRRDVDVLLRLTKEKLADLIKTQRSIFDKSYNLTKKGGHIIYVTCSFFNEENELQVKYFLENYKLELVPAKNLFDTHINNNLHINEFYKTNPLMYDMDGFFSAVFKVL